MLKLTREELADKIKKQLPPEFDFSQHFLDEVVDDDFLHQAEALTVVQVALELGARILRCKHTDIHDSYRANGEYLDLLPTDAEKIKNYSNILEGECPFCEKTYSSN